MWDQRVSLEQVLQSKEQRRQKIFHLLKKYNLPVVCVTTVTVGAVKLTQDACICGQRAADFVAEQFDGQICYADYSYLSTGFQALFVISANAVDIKKEAIKYETNDILGRLADIDVTDINGQQIDRGQLGFGQRNCLICSHSAQECYINSTHTQQQLNDAIKSIVDQYKKVFGEQ